MPHLSCSTLPSLLAAQSPISFVRHPDAGERVGADHTSADARKIPQLVRLAAVSRSI
jgi:hypothetical protein